MDTFALVRSEHLNHYGFLFGGKLLQWVDEYAWLCATREFPGCSLVTVGMDNVEFHTQVKNGSILRFSTNRLRKGVTSVTYTTKVFGCEPGAFDEIAVFSTHITFVCVDGSGAKTALPEPKG